MLIEQRARVACLVGVVVSTVAGCASIHPRAGFRDVARLVEARSSVRLAWPGSPEAEARVDATVATALAESLTVESAVRVTLLNNRSLRALYEDLGVAEAELVQAGLLPNPVLTTNLRFGVGPSGTGAELGLAQDLIAALQIPLKRRVAATRREAATLEVANAVLNLVLDTKVAFYRLQGALQLFDLRTRVVESTKIAQDVAERQHAAGNITDLQLATERAAYEEARIDLAAVESAMLADREDVNVLLGLYGPQAAAWTIAPHLPALPAVELAESGLETLAVRQRLDLARARLRTEEELGQYRLSRLFGLIPASTAGPHAERELEGTWAVGPMLELPLPLFDQRQTELAASAARARASDERHADLAIRIRADVRRARMRLAAARARAEHYERVVVPLQKQIVEQTQREYNAMLIGVFQLLQAKRSEVEAGQRSIEALVDYWLARTELERSVGGDLRLPEMASESADGLSPSPDGGNTAAAHPDHHHGNGD